MRVLSLLSLLSLLCSALGASPSYAAPQKFGADISLQTLTSLKSAVSAYDEFKGKDILATGTVTKVCQKKGCWMMIKTEVEDLRVTFKDYAFFVPFSAAGQTARLQGRIEKKAVSVKDQKHLLEDEGAPKDKIEAIKSARVEYSFVAAGVELGQ